jgi:hypothetical protein
MNLLRQDAVPASSVGKQGRIAPAGHMGVVKPAPAQAGVDGAIGNTFQIGSTP